MEEWILKSDQRYRYQLLDRMRQDCEYYLGNGNRSTNSLWAGNEKDQIQAMKTIWNSFSDDEKPEWLTWYDILEYERMMTPVN